MSFLFHSNPEDFNNPDCPSNFADQFPILAVMEKNGGIIHRFDSAVGSLIKIHKASPDQLKLVGHVVAKWMKETELVSKGGVINASLQRRGELVLDDKTGKEVLKIKALLSVVYTTSKSDGKINAKFGHLSKEETIISNFNILFKIRDELNTLLNKAGVKASILTNAQEILSESRAFWSESPCKQTDLPQDPIPYFAKNLSITNGRTFWRDGGYIRMMYEMRTPPIFFNRNTTTEENIANLLGFENKIPGNFIVLLSTGSTEKQAFPMTGNYKLQSKISNNINNKINSLSLSCIFIHSHPWRDAHGVVGTHGEWEFLDNLEESVIGKLFKLANGAVFSVVDAVWPKILYNLVPGSERHEMHIGEKTTSLTLDPEIIDRVMEPKAIYKKD